MAHVYICDVRFSVDADHDRALAQLMLAEAGFETCPVLNDIDAPVGDDVLEARWPTIGLNNGLKIVSTTTLSDKECEHIVNASLELFDDDLRELAHMSTVMIEEPANAPRAFLNVYLMFHESVFGEVFAV